MLLAMSARSGLLLDVLSRLLPPRQTAPPDRDRWNDEYQNSGWDWLSDVGQTPHNYVIAGYCIRLRPRPAILDVGCGEGVLHGILGRLGYQRYVGIDLSAAAIERVASKSDDSTRFLVSEAESFTTNERFDIVVLNEVLYYFADPMQVLSHLSMHLAPEGLFVVSMCQAGVRDALSKQRIWRGIDRGHRLVTELSLEDGSGLPRIIKVIQPCAPTGAACVPPRAS